VCVCAREREKERERENVYFSIYILTYIYIYVYVYRCVSFSSSSSRRSAPSRSSSASSLRPPKLPALWALGCLRASGTQFTRFTGTNTDTAFRYSLYLLYWYKSTNTDTLDLRSFLFTLLRVTGASSEVILFLF
jgi:hypothetical protein